ncbi:MAG: DNA polymerase III subunit delta [Sphingomonadaceae bacterium]|nr:DNA polymerase III subunit delta [Sphingomonadaceae bacterium]
MKATRAQIERALDKPDAAVRLFLLYGPDESGSRALAARIGKALGPEAERTDIAAAALRQDPALLASEAAAISMFGSTRYVRVEAVGEESLAAVAALLEAPAAGNPVVLIAGALRKDSKLLTLALGAPAALVFASYPPEAADADRQIVELARAHGLQISREAARAITSDSGGDIAVATREIEKLALYCDASADHPRALDETQELLGADAREGNLDRMVDLVLAGRADIAAGELARLGGEGREGVPLLNAVTRRLLQLATARAAADGGESSEAALRRARIFPKRGQEAQAERQLAQWRGDRIEAAIDRLGAAQRALRESGGPGAIAAEEALLAIARGVRRTR